MGNAFSCWSIGVAGHAHAMEVDRKEVGAAEFRQRTRCGADVVDALELRRACSLRRKRAFDGVVRRLASCLLKEIAGW